MTKPQHDLKPGWSPTDYLGWGIAVTFLGGILSLSLIASEVEGLGYLLLGVTMLTGGLSLSIGVVARGVQVGRMWSPDR